MNECSRGSGHRGSKFHATGERVPAAPMRSEASTPSESQQLIFSHRDRPVGRLGAEVDRESRPVMRPMPGQCHERSDPPGSGPSARPLRRSAMSPAPETSDPPRRRKRAVGGGWPRRPAWQLRGRSRRTLDGFGCDGCYSFRNLLWQQLGGGRFVWAKTRRVQNVHSDLLGTCTGSSPISLR